MRASIVNDQISADLNTALELMLECGCREFELRQLGLDGVLDADPRWLALAEKAVHIKRFRITQIATDFFSKPMDEGGLPSEERITKLFDLAKKLHCLRVSIFGCHIDDLGDDPEVEEGEDVPAVILPVDECMDALDAFVKRAAAEKIEVTLRSHHETCAGTAEEAVALIDTLEAPNLGLDWDVGECFAAGDGTGLDEIELVKPHLKVIHMRDGVRKGMAGAEWSTLGKGVIPWEDLIDQLHVANYRGPIVCDPCVVPKLKESRHALSSLLKWIDTARLRKRPGKDNEKVKGKGRIIDLGDESDDYDSRR
ncbi:MAG: sugar phosphate isomerase/epimerase [Planctomycetota bacterium]